jgi:hypothetical protein
MRRNTAALFTIVLAVLLLAAPRLSAQARALNLVLPDVNFQGVALSDAFEYVRDVTNINLHVDWKSLEAAGVDKGAPVNIRLRNVPIRKLLGLLLNEAGGQGGALLTFYADENIVEVTTREVADKLMITRVYPIEDLIVEIPDFAGPSLNITENNQGSGGRGGGGGGGGGILNGQGGNRDQNEKQLTRAERAQQLIEVIQETIQPDIWQANGGTAAIRFFNGSLIVTAPRSVHEALGR